MEGVHFDRMVEQLRRAPGIHMQVSTQEAFILVSQLQLALRHPGNCGPTSDVARDIAMTLQQGIMSQVPEAKGLLERGWETAFDV